MFIDTHCHLDFDIFDKTRSKIILECQNHSISSFINPATEYNRWDKLLSLNKEFPIINVCFGLHPLFIESHTNIHIEFLEKYTCDINSKLIGEIGLDKRANHFDKQLNLFASQLSIAKNLNKQVIIHSVKSHNETIKAIKNTKFQNGGVIHAFNGNIDIAKTYLDLGFKLGVGGLITYPNSKLRSALKRIPIGMIVLETDSPDMKLYKSEQDINTPMSIIDIFDTLCDIYQINTDILKQQIYKNSLDLI
jgi:TatD DNase family protein